MRLLLSVAGLAALSQSASAQPLLKTEPYHLAPFAVVYVDNGSCTSGKMLKVTGPIGALHRKKVCVPMGREEASRVTAIP